MTTINQSDIKNRVTDWLQRIDTIYSSVRSAVKDMRDIECKTTKKVVLHEDLMQKYDVAPTDVPVLDIIKSSSLLASFKPIGLWVIGANGRIDILTKNGALILTDVSEEGNPQLESVFTQRQK